MDFMSSCHGTALPLFGSALLLISVGCDFEPQAAEREYSLSNSNLAELEASPDVQAQILGALEMLFGTPKDPQFMLTSDWLDEGYNPNWPTYAADDNGGGEFTEAELDALHADNTRRFSGALALIDAGDYDAVASTFMPKSMAENWRELLQERDDELFESDEEFRVAAREAFETFYPSLTQSAEFYRLECLHCHGNDGGGDGTTAQFLKPRPRDYRKGIFKFTALSDKATPRREDLFRIIADGVYTTAMPSFRRFSDAEIHGVAGYVRLLAMRGQVETRLTRAYLDDEAITPDAVVTAYLDTWERWSGSDEFVITFDGEIPEATAARIERGRELFMDASTGNCFSCHGERGLGNGVSAFESNEAGELVRIKDDWGNEITPRNLAKGIFRFGRRPIDIYRRIYAGINGTPMPGLGTATKANGDPLLSDEEMWSLVHYVRSLGEFEGGFGLNAFSLVDSHKGSHGQHTSHENEQSALPADLSEPNTRAH